MAKKKKKKKIKGKKNGKGQSTIDSSFKKDKKNIFGRIEETIKSIPSDVIAESEHDDILSAVKSASAEDQRKFIHLCERLKDAENKHNAARKGLEGDRQAIKHEKGELEIEREKLLSEINDKEDEVAKEKESIEDTMKELSEREEDLIKREKNALLGFKKEKENEFATLLAQQDAIHKLEEETNNKLLEEKKKWHKEKINLQKDFNSEIQQQRDDLIQREGTLEALTEQVKRKSKRLEVEWQDIEQEKDDFQSKVEALAKEKNDQLAERYKQLKARKDAISLELEKRNGDLQSWEFLRKEFGEDCSPNNIKQRIAILQQGKQELQRRLDEKPDGDFESRYEEIRQERNEFEQNNYDLQQKLNEATRKLSNASISVIEDERKESQLRVLEKHKEFMGAAVRQLENEVDSLIDRQENKEVFPALSKIDADSNLQRERSNLDNVQSLESFVEELQHRIAWNSSSKKELYYSIEDIRIFVAGLAMSKLHILQGISGTGKTSLVTAFARAVGGGITDIAVQAGWRDRDDLIGHYNSFEKRFSEKETLQGLYRAQSPQFRNRIYIILLDEMNLSRPEQYFADFLSALELDKEDRRLKFDFSPSSTPDGFVDNKYLQVPENVWFIGTANHDETTMEFADKTYDRSHVMVLPRHEEHFSIDKDLDDVNYSYNSLREMFLEAKKNNQSANKDANEFFHRESPLALALEKYFDVGWGNRLERQINDFVPVVVDAGGNVAEAIDHLLATKVLRKGKVTDRYDTDENDLMELKNAFNENWKLLGIDQDISETKSMGLIEKEIAKKNKNI